MKDSLASVLIVSILIFASYRGISMLTSEPMIALANNSDMIHVQACIGAYPVRDSFLLLGPIVLVHQ